MGVPQPSQYRNGAWEPVEKHSEDAKEGDAEFIKIKECVFLDIFLEGKWQKYEQFGCARIYNYLKLMSDGYSREKISDIEKNWQDLDY